MIKFFGPAQDDAGNKLTGYSVRILDSDGSQVSIFSDSAGTDFQPTANIASVNDDGMVLFWWSPAGGQTYQLLNPEGLIETQIEDFASQYDKGALFGSDSVPTRSALSARSSKNLDKMFLSEFDREGDFVFSSSDLSAEVTADVEQGIYVAPDSDNTGESGAWVRQYDGPLQANWFGDVGAAVDSALAITAAIAYSTATVTNGAFESVQIPAGEIGIDTIIDRTGTGNYVDLVGAGMRNTIIKANTAMTHMLDLADTGEVTGRTLIEGITFDCNSLADRAIDAENMRYWFMRYCEIRNAASEGIKCGNWITSITDCHINGCPIGINIDGIDASPQAANNLVIKNNNFTTCPIGISVERESNDIHINENSFDHCENVGVWVKLGGRNINIEDNYFERCGKDLADIDGTGVTIDIDSSTTDSVASAIIIGYDPNSTIGTTWTGTIAENFFANCHSERLITLLNVEYGDVRDNRVHSTYSTNYLVELMGFGCSSLCKKLAVTGGYATGVVGELVNLNALDPEDNHMNLQVSNLRDTGSDLRGGFYWSDPTSGAWSGAGKAGITTAYHSGQIVYELQNTDDVEVSMTSLDAEDNIRGRYMRLHGMSRGVGGTAGCDVEIFVNGTSAGDRIIRQTKESTTFIEFGRGITFFIPTDATSVTLRIQSSSGSIPVEIKRFGICDASYPLDALPF